MEEEKERKEKKGLSGRRVREGEGEEKIVKGRKMIRAVGR